MTDRLLTPNERMTDAFDRASTLNFTVIAHLRGSTSEAALRAALDQLGERHPLLRAGLVRDGKRSRFVADGAAPISLSLRDGERDDWHALAERSLAHREWHGDGPRAELTYLREGEQSFSLLLCLHHVVSDGSSGILAMRDLLAFLAGAPISRAPVPSPGQNAFFPKQHGGLWSYARALAMVLRSARSERPRRLHKKSSVAFEQRVPRLKRFVLSSADSLALSSRARRAGATVHGVLCAATAQAVREQLDIAGSVQRVLHPVCLRRYLRELAPTGESPRDAVGCYVSSVETDHEVSADSELAQLAHEITRAVRKKKADGVPLLTAPIAGPMLTDRFASKPSAQLRELAESQLMPNTFSLTNLGQLEAQLGVRAEIEALRLEDLFFVAAGSILGALGASATSYRDALSYQLVGTTPLVTEAQIHAIAGRVESLLLDYARGAEA